MKKQPQDGFILLMAQMIFLWVVLFILNPTVQSQSTKFPDQFKHYSQETQKQYYRTLLQLEPWHPYAWEWILMDDFRRGDWSNYIQDGELALKNNVLSESGLLKLGDAYYRVDKKKQAVAVWSQIQNEEKTASLARIVKTQRELKDYKTALFYLKTWVDVEPANPKVFYQKGILETLYNPPDAIISLQQAAVLDKSIQSRFTLFKQIVESIKTDQTGIYPQVQLGRILLNWGEADIAEEKFQQIVNKTPDYAEAWAFLGEAKHQQGEDDFPSLEKAITLDPHSVAAQSLLGIYYLRNNQPEKAETYFSQLSIQEPQQAIWQVQWAESLARQGKPAFAMAHYQNALEIEPGNPVFWSMMVQFCLENDLELRRLGLPAARRLIALTPDDPLSYSLHGQILLAIGDKDNALQAFQRGLQLDPNSPRLLLDIGGFYFNENNFPDAFMYLSYAVSNGQKLNQKNIVTKAQSFLAQIP